MSIVKTTQPYEFLIRWDQDGAVSGQHVQYREVVKDTETGEIYSDKPGDALPITEMGDYPLSDVLAEVQILQAAEIETKRQTIDVTQQTLATAQSDLTASNAECATHIENIATLQTTTSDLAAEINTLQTTISDLETQVDDLSVENDQLKLDVEALS